MVRIARVSVSRGMPPAGDPAWAVRSGTNLNTDSVISTRNLHRSSDIGMAHRSAMAARSRSPPAFIRVGVRAWNGDVDETCLDYVAGVDAAATGGRPDLPGHDRIPGSAQRTCAGTACRCRSGPAPAREQALERRSVQGAERAGTICLVHNAEELQYR